MLDTIFILYATMNSMRPHLPRGDRSRWRHLRSVTSAVATLKVHCTAAPMRIDEMLMEIGTPDRAEALLMKKLGRRPKSWVLAIAFTKQAIPACQRCARSLATFGKPRGRELGADLREARTSDGTGETIVRHVRSLRRARVLAVGISSRIEYAVVCCVPR